MERIRLGFIPSHREPFDEAWAVQMRKRCLDVFDKIPFLDIIVPDGSLTPGGLVRGDEDANKAVRLFKDKDINGLIIGTMTFGDEVSALTIAHEFKHFPVLLFGTQEGPFTSDGARRSDSFCGTLAISSGLHRRKIPFSFAGIVFPEQQQFKEDISNFIRVCAVVRGFTGTRIGLIGPRPERFQTCISNEDALILKFKQTIVPTSLLDIMIKQENLKINSPYLRKIIQEMKREANLSTVRNSALINMAKLQHAIKQFASEKGLSAVAVQCWTAIQEAYGISACYALGRITDSGLMASCEVDVYGALTMLIQYLASMGEQRPHFIDWTIKHQKKDNVFLSWHCGNAPPSLACNRDAINLKSHSILSKQLGSESSKGAAEFQLKPGVVTLCRLSEFDSNFKMLITEGEIIPSEQRLRGSWSWVKVANLNNLYDTLVREGFTHHASQIHGNYLRPIQDACAFLGIETVLV